RRRLRKENYEQVLLTRFSSGRILPLSQARHTLKKATIDPVDRASPTHTNSAHSTTAAASARPAGVRSLITIPGSLLPYLH
ncbi:hypothetical protein SK128_007420, partial [Halocaridina rubra]